jgi:hypothetical protein
MVIDHDQPAGGRPLVGQRDQRWCGWGVRCPDRLVGRVMNQDNRVADEFLLTP